MKYFIAIVLLLNFANIGFAQVNNQSESKSEGQQRFEKDQKEVLKEAARAAEEKKKEKNSDPIHKDRIPVNGASVGGEKKGDNLELNVRKSY